jgi:hypothetical protein
MKKKCPFILSRSRLLLSILLLGALAAGCKPTPATVVVATATLPPTELPATPVPTSVPSTPDPLSGWQKYENPAYGFSFYYPETWSLEEINAANQPATNRTLLLRQGSNQLSIEYGFLYEIMGIGANLIGDKEMLSGEIEEGESVFFTQPLTRSALIDGGLFKRVFYPAPGGYTLVDDMFFHISLQETARLALNEINLPEALLEEVDGILATFTHIELSGTTPDPSPGWNTYVNLAYGFSLRYPSDWQVTETEMEISASVPEKMVLLEKEHFRLIICYHFTEEYIPR